MQDHRLTRQTAAQAAPIMEALDAGESQANRISIVPMHRVCVAMQESFDAFYSVGQFRPGDPVGSGIRGIAVHRTLRLRLADLREHH
jgi:hypothetical protein